MPKHNLLENTTSHIKNLFTLLSEGNETAFEQIFHHYVPHISRTIFNIVKSKTITKDLVQNTFMQLWLNRDRLTDLENPILWLNRIAYNEAYMHIRRQLIHEKVTANISRAQPLEDQHYEGEQYTSLKETKQLIQQAIHQLHDQSRRIYQLNRVVGMKPQAIADELGISVQSVRNSLTRSAKIIRDYLIEHGISIPLLLLLLPLPDFF